MRRASRSVSRRLFFLIREGDEAHDSLSQVQTGIDVRNYFRRSMTFLPSFVKSHLSPGHSSNDWGFFLMRA